MLIQEITQLAMRLNNEAFCGTSNVAAEPAQLTLENLEEALNIIPKNDSRGKRLSELLGYPMKPVEVRFDTEMVHVGYQLNRYKFSKNRSARKIKKLVHGTRKQRPVVAKIWEERKIEPKPFWAFSLSMARRHGPGIIADLTTS